MCLCLVSGCSIVLCSSAWARVVLDSVQTLPQHGVTDKPLLMVHPQFF